MRRHPLEPFSLIFGALFTFVGLVFLFGSVDVTTLPPALTWPVPLIVIGVAIILLAVGGRERPASGRPESEPTTSAPVEDVDQWQTGAETPAHANDDRGTGDDRFD